MKKRSLLQRLSGSHHDDDYEFEEDYAPAERRSIPVGQTPPASHVPEKAEGHLPVDLYQTANDLVIRTFVAGVRPEDLNVSISRDMVVIEGSREERDNTGDFFNQELFWGAFARTIMLPQEVDVDGASASSKDGLLIITLPKLDRTRQTKLRIKSS